MGVKMHSGGNSILMSQSIVLSLLVLSLMVREAMPLLNRPPRPPYGALPADETPSS